MSGIEICLVRSPVVLITSRECSMLTVYAINPRGQGASYQKEGMREFGGEDGDTSFSGSFRDATIKQALIDGRRQWSSFLR